MASTSRSRTFTDSPWLTETSASAWVAPWRRASSRARPATSASGRVAGLESADRLIGRDSRGWLGLNCTSRSHFNRVPRTAVSQQEDPEERAPEAGERPSKSARKRAAHAAQDLGEELMRLREAQLEALELPEELKEAVRLARRITSRAGLARQRQYIGKLMRDIDPEPIRAALSSRSAADARETERFKRVEGWRERLISEGPPALAELSRWHPDI